jgi:hypothetical protein
MGSVNARFAFITALEHAGMEIVAPRTIQQAAMAVK